MQYGGKSLPSISLPSNDTPGEARDFNANDGSYSEPYKYHEDHSYAKSKFISNAREFLIRGEDSGEGLC